MMRLSSLQPGGSFMLRRPKTCTLFYGKFGTDDIRQGKIQNCFFLAALALLTQSERHIERIRDVLE
jgi:hypothetical protein